MIYKLQKSQQIEVPDARTNLEMLLKDWINRAITDNAKAIREIKALDSTSFEQMRQKLIAGIRPVLPNSDEHATSIIDGLLNLDGSPYYVYLKEHFSHELRVTAQTMIAKKLTDIYEPNLRDFIKQEIKKGDLGDYFFHLQKLDLKTEKLSSIELTVISEAVLKAKVKVNSDKQIHDVEKDEVGLSAHLNDLNPKFHQYLKKLLLSNNLENAYNSLIKEQFKSLHHGQAIVKIGSVINMFAGKAKRAA